ncbi:MAG: response regulator transcription factor, partial [Proteobacteria bacterium]|nr:response regulator transcription factor [Pseudomonadota bacterium]
MRVLIADDSQSIRFRMRLSLEKLGYEVLETNSGTEALEILSGRDAPSIAVLDWMMDGLEGVVVCERLRERLAKEAPETIQPYLIMMTSRSDSEDISIGLNAGADDYLTKPWNDIELAARLEVAERAVDIQRQFQIIIKQQEIVLKRYNLLCEVVTKRSPVSIPAAPNMVANAITEASLEQKANNRERGTYIEASVGLQTILTSTFSEMGLGRPSVTKTKQPKEIGDLEHLLWTAIYLEEKGKWIDIQVEIGGESAELLYLGILGDQNPLQNIGETIAEMLNLVQKVLVTALCDAGIQAVTVTLPKVVSNKKHVVPGNSSKNSLEYEVDFSQMKFFLRVSEYESPAKNKEVNGITEYDVLYEPYISPWNPNTTILKKGEVLNSIAIKKVRKIADEVLGGSEVKVIEPSPLGRV